MRECSYRAAFGQARHWRLQHQQPASAALNIGFALHLEGPLDADALEAALGDLIERHGLLRATFAQRDGELWIDERSWEGWRLPVRELAEGGRDAADAALSLEAARPFDLADSVFRALLVRTPGLASLGLVFHHSVFDGWSFNVFFAELVALYNAHVEGRPRRRSVRTRPYSEFADWQRETLASGAWDGQFEHWREQLAGVVPGPTLPRDADAGAPPYPVALATLALTPASSELVQRTAARSRAVPFVVLLGAYQAALAGASGRDDVVIGCPFVGRRHDVWRGTIGLFVNTVPLRAALGDDPALGDVVRRARTAVRDGHANQDVPLDRIMAEVLDAPSFSGLFDTLAQMQSAEGDIPAFKDLALELVPLWNVHTKYDLLVSFGRRHDRFVALFEYNAAALREETMLAFAARWAHALCELCHRPDLRVSGLGDGPPAPGVFRPTPVRDLPAVGLRSVLAEADLAAREGLHFC